MIIFDCDGVVLNSNSIKTEAFALIGKRYGEFESCELVKFHQENGGISRFEKFTYFVKSVLKKNDDELITSLCSDFKSILSNNLLNCEINPNLHELKKMTQGIPWMMVTGAPQCEVKTLLKNIGILNYFNNGVFGAPNTKFEIFKNQIDLGRLPVNSIYIGDSKKDYEAASRFGINFVFYSPWTEVSDWEGFCKLNAIQVIANLMDIELIYKK